MTLQYYTGVGQGTDEERFELAKEQYAIFLLNNLHNLIY